MPDTPERLEYQFSINDNSQSGAASARANLESIRSAAQRVTATARQASGAVTNAANSAGNAAEKSADAAKRARANLAEALRTMSPEKFRETYKLGEYAEQSADKAGGALAQVSGGLREIGDAARNVRESVPGIGTAFEGVQKSISRTAGAIKSALRRVLMISVITRAVRNLIAYLKPAMLTNSQFAQSLAQVKANLLTAFAPIWNTIQPMLVNFMNWLAKVTGYIAQFMAILFGTTYSRAKSSAKALDTAARSTDKLTKAQKKSKKAAEGQLAAFDEINDITANMADSAGAAASGSQGKAKPIAPDFSADAAKLPGWMEKIAKVIRKIATGIRDTVASVVGWVTAQISEGTPIGRAIQWIADFAEQNADKIFLAISGLWLGLKGLGIFTAIAAMVTKVVAFLGPYGLLAVAIGAMVVLVATHWDEVKEGLKRLGKNISEWFSGVKARMSEFMAVVKARWDAGWSAIGQFFVGIWNGIVNGAKEFGSRVKAAGDQLWQGILGAVDKFKTAWNNAWKAVGNFFIGIWNGIVTGVEKAVNFVIGGLNGIIKAINKVTGVAGQALKVFGINIKTQIGLIAEVKFGRVPYLAEGGIVNAGQLFIARERGAELVGNFGSNTGVANNQQILTAMRQAVYDSMVAAMADSSGQSHETIVDGQMNVDGTTFGRIVVRAIRGEERRTGRQLLMGVSG